MAGKRQFGTIVKRGERYHVQLRHEGRRIQRSAGRTRREAERKLARLEVVIADGMPFEDALRKAFGGGEPGMTFKAASAVYLKAAERDLRPGTFRTYVSILRAACRARFATKPLRHIRAADLECWLLTVREGGAAPSTSNRYVSTLSSVFQLMRRLGHMEGNPALEVERQSEKGRERTEWLSQREAVALLGCCERGFGFREAVTTGLLCGLRRGELVALRRRHVDLERRQVIIEAADAKSRKARTVPMPETLALQINALMKARKILRPDGEDPLFASPEGRGLTVDVFDNAFRRAVEACDEIPGDRKPRITPHTLRRTFATWGVQRTGNLYAVQKLLGHSSPALTAKHYARYSLSDGQPIVDAVALSLEEGKAADTAKEASS